MNCPSGDENHVIARHPALRREREREKIVCSFAGLFGIAAGGGAADAVVIVVVVAAAAAAAVIFNVLIQKRN